MPPGHEHIAVVAAQDLDFVSSTVVEVFELVSTGRERDVCAKDSCALRLPVVKANPNQLGSWPALTN
jgi:hypothetical protein